MLKIIVRPTETIKAIIAVPTSLVQRYVTPNDAAHVMNVWVFIY